MELSLAQISAVIPVGGGPPPELPEFGEIILTRGEGLWHRWEAASRARHAVIYTQDDDCVVDIAALLAKYRGGVLCNMPVWKRPEYPDGIALVGWGALFTPASLGVFSQYLSRWPADEIFIREADRVFTGLNQRELADVPFEHMPKAFGSDRLGAQKNHLENLAEIRRRIYAVR